MPWAPVPGPVVSPAVHGGRVPQAREGAAVVAIETFEAADSGAQQIHQPAVYAEGVTVNDWVFKWRARCVHVVDGDTIDAALDVGFRDVSTQRIRLANINCPEIHGPTKAAGDAATAFTTAWLAPTLGVDWPLTIITEKGDSFGRYVAIVWRGDDPVSLNDALLASGNAVPFMVDPTLA